MSGLVSMTGDRPTGALHLGHYAGSLSTRLELQHSCKRQYIMLADIQAMCNSNISVEDIQNNAIEIVKDYLSIGLLPEKNVIFLQSNIIQLHEIVTYFSTLTTLSHMTSNPTILQEIKSQNLYKESNIGIDNTNMNFLMHPISQAADITAFMADIVPVGADQLPLIYRTNDIVNSFNHKFSPTLKKCRPQLAKYQRLVGIDGKAKASKSLNNAIMLSDSEETLRNKVNSMYTDPNHINIKDPGCVEGNVVFEYLTVFYEDKKYIEDLKSQYRKGGLGDVFLKNLLFNTLNTFLQPIRERRAKLSNSYVKEILAYGSDQASSIAQDTVEKIRNAMGFL